MRFDVELNVDGIMSRVRTSTHFLVFDRTSHAGIQILFRQNPHRSVSNASVHGVNTPVVRGPLDRRRDGKLVCGPRLRAGAIRQVDVGLQPSQRHAKPADPLRH